MKDWALAWTNIAREDLLRVHWETAGRIDAAMQRFAATGEGPLRRVMIGGSVERRLLIPPYAAVVTLDRGARIVTVWRIVRYAS